MSPEQIILEFRALESKRLVRICAEPETESYFSVFGEPDSAQERQQMLDTIENLGCWCVVSEFYADGAWHHSDSVGFCTGYENPLKPEENFYVVDLMRAAIDSLNRPEPV